MVFKNSKIYDLLVYIAQIVLPAVIVLITSLGTAWGWQTEAICLTIAAIDVFMGALLKISSNRYHNSQEDESNVE